MYSVTVAYPNEGGILYLVIIVPVIMTIKQLITRKMNPVSIEDESSTSFSLSPVRLASAVNPAPNPMSILNMGPAKQAVIAIFASPFLAMVTFAAKSPILLPQANIVIPRIEPGIRRITPKNPNKPTNWSAIASIHVAATIKPQSAIGV